MNRYVCFFLLLATTLSSYAQGLKVLITEKQSGKRLVLMAENKTTDTLNVFLMVNATGYRKSASKPVIKNIAPGKKIPMITLIALEGEESAYTYDLIVNEEELDVSISHENQVKDIQKNIQDRIVIFVTPDCDKCTALANLLTEKKIEHRVFDIHENQVMYRQFMTFIEKELTLETRIRFPVVWNKTTTIFGFEEMENILAKLEGS